MKGIKLSRRRFVSAAAFGVTGLASRAFPSSPPATTQTLKRKFYTVLSLGRIGFKASFQESVELAVRHGFEGVDPDPGYFSQLPDGEMQKLLNDLKARNLKLGAAGLPVEFRKDEATFNEGLKKLPGTAKVLERAGITRVGTWVLSFSDDLTYLQNFRQHAYRLRACAEILQNHGQRLGLEYVGPKTSWVSAKNPFIHTLSETKELLVAIGTDKLGVQLDSYHWYNAGERQEDLLTLRNQDVATVDINDAPAGVPRDKLVDLSRELPAATGVIPIKQFLDSLVEIGYDGPIQAEPFNAALRAMPLDRACAATAAAINKAFGIAGIV